MLRRILGRKSEPDIEEQPAGLARYRFAAVDVETTGLYPGGHDRVVEIAIVSFSLDGDIEDEFHTLVNPNRDIGAERIHGLTMADLAPAPAFRDVTPEVVRRLRERVMVAHNSNFDIGFLEAEFERAGVVAPPLPHLCTMRLVARGGYGRRLADVCGRLGVEHRDRHTALGDARAVAFVLMRWHGLHPSRQGLSLSDCGCHVEPAPHRWPELSGGRPSLARPEASRLLANDRGYLGRLVSEMPEMGRANSDADATYLDLLERALEDRHLSRAEAEQLRALAVDTGLGAADVRRLHEEFFDALVRAAWSDGHLSQLELADIRLVGEFLAIPMNRIAAASVRPAPTSVTPEAMKTPSGLTEDEFTITPGMTVCFTGQLRATIYGQGVSREQAHNIAETAGLVVLNNVTKRLDVLVVADPLSVSGKAKKAREYGTRIVAEPVFWKAIGVDFD